MSSVPAKAGDDQFLLNVEKSAGSRTPDSKKSVQASSVPNSHM